VKHGAETTLAALLAAAADSERAEPVPPPADLRQHLLELARAPRGPIDLAAYTWQPLMDGVRVHVVEEDAARDFRAVLVWADPGARVPPHRHLGDEEIYVLQGRLRDERGEYGPGDVCRSRAGSVHSEEAVTAEECVCYIVYHGGYEVV
jgi:putative transcriptional regulator